MGIIDGTFLGAVYRALEAAPRDWLERFALPLERWAFRPVMVGVEFMGAITFLAEYGEALVQKLAGESPATAPEARSALAQGKLVAAAKIKLTRDDLEYTFTLRGQSFDLGGVKLPVPRGLPFAEAAEYRLKALEALTATLWGLFAVFVQLRLDGEMWGEQLRAIREMA